MNTSKALNVRTLISMAQALLLIGCGGSVDTKIDPVVPDSPTALVAAANGADEVVLTWQDNSNGESQEDGFVIERSLTNGNDFAALAERTSTDVNSFTDSSLAADTTYYYRVKAFKADGLSPASNVAFAKTELAASLLVEPASVEIFCTPLDTAKQYILSVSNSGGGAFSWSASDNADWLTLSPTSAVNAASLVVSINCEDFTLGTTQHADVTVDAETAGSATIPVTVNVAEQPPAFELAPESLTLSCASGETSAPKTVQVNNVGGGTLGWTASGMPGWLSVTPVSFTGSKSVEFRATCGATDDSATVTFSAPGAVSRSVAVTLDVLPIPQAPSNLAAVTVDSRNLRVSFTDNATNETEFRLERREMPSGTFALAKSISEKSGSGTTVTVSDPVPAAGTQFCYRARAYNTNGFSAYSPEACGTTFNYDKKVRAAKILVRVDVDGQSTLTVTNGTVRMTHDTGDISAPPKNASVWVNLLKEDGTWTVLMSSFMSLPTQVGYAPNWADPLVAKSLNGLVSNPDFSFLSTLKHFGNVTGSPTPAFNGDTRTVVINDSASAGYHTKVIAFEYWFGENVVVTAQPVAKELARAKITLWDMLVDGQDRLRVKDGAMKLIHILYDYHPTNPMVDAKRCELNGDFCTDAWGYDVRWDLGVYQNDGVTTCRYAPAGAIRTDCVSQPLALPLSDLLPGQFGRIANVVKNAGRDTARFDDDGTVYFSDGPVGSSGYNVTFDYYFMKNR